MCHFAVISCR